MGAAEIRAGVEQVLYRYAWGLDERDLDAVADCFTEDAELETTLSTLNGRAAIRDYYEGLRAAHERLGRTLRHLTTNVLIEEQPDGSVRVRSFYLLCVGTAGVLSTEWLGTYTDELVLDGGAWRFRRRRIDVDASAPQS